MVVLEVGNGDPAGMTTVDAGMLKVDAGAMLGAFGTTEVKADPEGPDTTTVLLPIIVWLG